MEEEKPVTPETSEGNEEQVEETVQEDTEAIKAELAKAKELAENYKIRAEKAERAKPKTETNLSQMDVIALAKADVAVEDMDEIVEFAKFKKITVGEALKNATLKTILSERNEERRTAQATQTKGSPRGTAKVSGEELLRKAESSGIIPESADEMRAITEARMARRRK